MALTFYDSLRSCCTFSPHKYRCAQRGHICYSKVGITFLTVFAGLITDGSKMGHRVSAALCHKRGTSAIRLPCATSIFNVELHAILLSLDVVRRSKEKHFLLLSDSYSSLIALGGSHVDQDTIYKYLKTYSTHTNSGKQSYSAGSPVTWGSLETRELIG